MKSILTSIVITMLVTIGCSQSDNQANDGFKGATWGMSYEEVYNVLDFSIDTTGGWFEVNDEELFVPISSQSRLAEGFTALRWQVDTTLVCDTFAGVLTDRVEFAFYGGQFYSVSIESKENHNEGSNFDIWSRTLTTAFGPVDSLHVETVSYPDGGIWIASDTAYVWQTEYTHYYLTDDNLTIFNPTISDRRWDSLQALPNSQKAIREKIIRDFEKSVNDLLK